MASQQRHPIHQQTPAGLILKCPYCCFVVSEIKKSTMSKHMRKSHPNPPAIDNSGELYHKYLLAPLPVPKKREKVEESSIYINDKDPKEDPVVASIRRKQYDGVLLFHSWLAIPEAEFASTVAYPIFAKAMISYVLNLTSYKKFDVVKLEHDMKAQTKRLETSLNDLTSAYQSCIKDMGEMTELFVDKKATFEGVIADIDIIKLKLDVKNQRDQIFRELEGKIYDIIDISQRELVAKLKREARETCSDACIKSMQAVLTLGVPHDEFLKTLHKAEREFYREKAETPSLFPPTEGAERRKELFRLQPEFSMIPDLVRMSVEARNPLPTRLRGQSDLLPPSATASTDN